MRLSEGLGPRHVWQVCFYIPVTCLHPPTVVREPTELQAHAEVDETDDLDDIEGRYIEDTCSACRAS